MLFREEKVPTSSTSWAAIKSHHHRKKQVELAAVSARHTLGNQELVTVLPAEVAVMDHQVVVHQRDQWAAPEEAVHQQQNSNN